MTIWLASIVIWGCTVILIFKAKCTCTASNQKRTSWRQSKESHYQWGALSFCPTQDWCHQGWGSSAQPSLWRKRRALHQCLKTCYKNPNKTNYYTSDSLWKIWLVKSIQSIHNSLWTWHDKSAAHISFIMSSSTSAWLLSPLECSQKQNDWTLCFCFWGWIMWKMYNKTIIEFGFRMISWIIKTSCLCYLPQPSASAGNTDLSFDNSWYHAQPHPIIVY